VCYLETGLGSALLHLKRIIMEIVRATQTFTRSSRDDYVSDTAVESIAISHCIAANIKSSMASPAFS
jgi:hypothetical protein